MKSSVSAGKIRPKDFFLPPLRHIKHIKSSDSLYFSEIAKQTGTQVRNTHIYNEKRVIVKFQKKSV